MSKSKAVSAAKRGREFWMEQLRRCERSGGSLRTYARAQGLNEHTAYAWRKRLRRTGELGGGEGQRWARVQVASVSRVSARYRVQLPNGIAVEVAGPIEEAELERLLRVVVGR